MQAYLAEMATENNAELMTRALADVARARKRWILPPPRITLGSMAGRITVSDDFDAPLTDDEMRKHAGDLPPSDEAK